MAMLVATGGYGIEIIEQMLHDLHYNCLKNYGKTMEIWFHLTGAKRREWMGCWGLLGLWNC